MSKNKSSKLRELLGAKKVVIPVAVGLAICLTGGILLATSENDDTDKVSNVANHQQEESKDSKEEKKPSKKDGEKEGILLADGWQASVDSKDSKSENAVNSVIKPNYKPSKPSGNAESTGSQAKPEQKPSKPETKPEQKPSKPESKPEEKPSKPETKPEDKPSKPETKPDIPMTPLEPSTPSEKPDIPLTPLEPSTPTEKPEEKPDIPLTPLEPSTPSEKPEEKPDIPLTPLEPSIPTEKPEEKPGIPMTPLEPAMVWVVDEEAWTETIDDKTRPIYEWVDTWWVKFKDGTKKVYYDELEMMDFIYSNAPLISSWGTGEMEEIIVGYEKITIHHPEKGHWEYPQMPIEE